MASPGPFDVRVRDLHCPPWIDQWRWDQAVGEIGDLVIGREVGKKIERRPDGELIVCSMIALDAASCRRFAAFFKSRPEEVADESPTWRPDEEPDDVPWRRDPNWWQED